MSNTTTSLENLQTALSMELSAATQYLLHAHVLDDWGLNKLAAKMREEMQEELGHAGRFIDRILFLGGDPVLTPQKTPVRAKSLQEMFELDKVDERDAIDTYTRAARAAFDADDIGSRALFEEIVLDEEGHWAWLDLQLDLLERMGEPAFTAKYMDVEDED
ncbi:bacterioferritin [Pseudodonghicola xiamenensis]|uniref:Bacterioferritin n=1 Tax=Pseudodonghicola xiamenensis TaxID=337702 RepID=A0A8J3H7D2_9RHOB|nr:bacterioferritin [Pseudodonghicola xiamenensis]GHG87391.1 bacterioferritin [Pseudodonghicola xiamenensis]